MPTITGTSGADNLVGTDEDDIIDGAGGTDTITGRGGNDQISGNGNLFGGDGDDTIVILGRNSYVDGGAGFDTFDGRSVLATNSQLGSPYYSRFRWTVDNNNQLVLTNEYGQSNSGSGPTIERVADISGVERILGSNGRVENIFSLGALTQAITIVGGANVVNTITGGLGDDTITGGSTHDTIDGGGGADVIRAGSGNDRLAVGAGDQIFGEDGDDIFNLNSASALAGRFDLDGGSGDDRLSINVTGATTDLTIGSPDHPWLVNIEQVTVSTFTAVGRRATVTIYGGDEANTFQFGSFDPTNVRFFGGGGNDVLRVTLANSGDHLLSGGDGDDNITIAKGVAHGDAGNDTISASIGASAYGDAGDDLITGAGSLYGGEGNDQLSGNGLLEGGAGNDILTISSAAGTSLRDGGDGIDTFVVVTASEVSLTTGVVRAVGSTSPGAPTLVSIENLAGSSAADRLEGDAGANVITGGGGDDLLYGAAGDDALYGDAGVDRLEGGEGADRLDGGGGTDMLLGGDGNDVLVGGAGDDDLDGGVGDDTAFFATSIEAVTFSYEGGQIIVNGIGRDRLIGIEHLEFVDGRLDVGPDGRVILQPLTDIVGTAGADRLTGGNGRDNILGQGGDDVLDGGGNWDTLNGGEGYDIAQYVGVRRQYVASASSVTGGPLRGGPTPGTDSLTSIEALRFVDGTLTFDPNSLAAQVMRLYDAALDRQPDQGGFENLLDYMEGGGTLTALADAFIASAEFQSRYGNLTNRQFVEQLYRFTLNREGDPRGILDWTGQLDSGASRASVLIAFSESAEHRTVTQGVLNQGLWVADDQALIIARLYDATFDRVPDWRGLGDWTGNLKAGMSLTEIAGYFAASAEFQNTYGALTNQQFVEQMYRSSLNREGEAGGVAGWTNALNNGMTRAQVLVAFSESAEHVALTRNLWLGGVQYEAENAATSTVEGSAKIDHALTLPAAHDDAFVLPSQPDGWLDGFAPSVDDAVAAPLPATLPHPAGTDLLLLMPQEALFPGDPNAGSRDHLELNWA